MGGLGSGRSNREAMHVDRLIQLDISKLQASAFQLFQVFGLVWRDGCKEVARAKCEHLGENIRLSYFYDRNFKVSEDIVLQRTEINFGGSRVWFNCPSCGKRCRILYLTKRVECRTCARLVYPSQYNQFRVPGEAAALTIRTKLSVNPNYEIIGFEKPKGMHWRTYRKLEQVVWNADVAFDNSILNALTQEGL